MPEKVTTEALFELHEHKLSLTWVLGQLGKHPNQVQVLGQWEFKYFENLGENSYHDVLQQLFNEHPAAVIIADDLSVGEPFIYNANKSNTPLFSSAVSRQIVVNRLHYYLEYKLAESSIMHGVFIEVNGLGVLNVQIMFGDSVIKQAKNLHLIIRLKSMDDKEIMLLDRLNGSDDTYNLLDVEVQASSVPVVPSRNLAVLVEAVTRQYIQLQSGYNASLNFMHKQQKLLESNTQ
ncbi:MAG: hypothetical protein GXP08_05870 [Gammaproteobacteria bacterium]|nr:hypothetical protein [Gammaproteobacteria bacterium]